MKQTLRLVLVLTVICVAAGVMLAWVNSIAAEPIEKAARAEKVAAIKTVLPPFDNDPDTDTVTVAADGKDWTFYVGHKDGAYAGAAFETVSHEGYGGDIRIMVGVTDDDNVSAIEILAAKETPGLGAKIAGDAFKQQFAGRAIAGTRWQVRKDRGDIDQITAATISSRAVVNALKKGLDVYMANRGAIVAGTGR